ncbi:MAG TPA: cytochrome c [Terriglobia bacterium]|nr:cytochrome c [Terriglobia bacterium]
MKLLRSLAWTLLVGGTIVYGVSLSFAAGKKPDGANIFTEKCSMCHGMDGKGYAAIKTPNFTDPKWQAAHPEKERINALENGVPGTAMISFKGKLNQQEMDAVLKYIRSLGAAKKK